MRVWNVLIALSLTAAAAPPEKDLGHRVWVSSLTAHTWRIRSISPIEGFGDVESNAVLAIGPKESVLVDTPVTIEQTTPILDWAEKELKRPVRVLIATHWHADRIGGIDAMAPRGIETYGLGKTIALARKNGKTPPQHELKPEQRLELAGVAIETFYPGHGHTADNIVVWISRENVLDGGCFVKGAESKNLGNVEEIDPASWKVAVAAVRKRYGSAAIVVPGHGAIGGQELLAHTAKLLER